MAVNESAHAFGIRRTMMLGEARALCAAVEHEEHDPAADRRSLEALARWMIRFTPVVSLPLSLPPGEGRGEGALANQIASHALLLDLTGCERVFAGLHNILDRLRTALAWMRVQAHLAVAPTPGAAWALTFDPNLRICEAESEDHLARAVAHLPPIGLRLDEPTVEALHHLGLETIGQVLDLPRELLPARFGPILTLRIDQMLGRVPEPLVPMPPPVSIKARMDFDGLVDSLETVWIVFRRLIERIIRQLLRHGRGAREVEVEFFRAYASTLRTTIRLSRPSRDAANLFNLLRCAMETIQTDQGFLGIGLNVISSERISEEQIHLLGGEEFTAAIELDHLIERLRVRLGPRVVVRAELVQSHVPEAACTYHGFSTPAGLPARADPCHLEAVRPLHLLSCPVEIRVMVSPSDDREGRPVLFAHRGESHRILHCVGPERIAGQWWQRHFRTRDYFDVENEQGQRFWIFRVQETGRWFLHGEFE